MKRWGIAGLLMLLLAAMLPPMPAWAGGADGVVVAVDPGARTFTLRRAAGMEEQLFLTSGTTRFTRGDRDVPFENLSLGGKVSVRYSRKDQGLVATRVTILRRDEPVAGGQ